MKKPAEMIGFPEAILEDPRWLHAVWRYQGWVSECTDGDGIWSLTDQGLRAYGYQKFRLDGYDAVELYTGTTESRAVGRLAANHLESLILNEHVGLITRKVDSTRSGETMSADRWAASCLFFDADSGRVFDVADVFPYPLTKEGYDSGAVYHG